MGALVGGAYATGMSVPDMEKINESMSVEKLFKEKPPRQELAMRRKIDDYSNLIGPEIGTASKQATIVQGRGHRACSWKPCCANWPGCEGYHDFDKLPIPFRAVATDLVTGKAVVFDEGELANVMRASMSVPGAVAPAEYRRHDPGRRHAHQQPAGGGGARDGRRRHHRRQRGHAAAQARGAEFDPGRGRADAQHPDRAERAGLAGQAQAHRHPDLARTRRLLHRRLRQPDQDHAAGRGRGAQGGRPAGATLAAPGRICGAAQAPAGGDGAGPDARWTRSGSRT